MSFKSRMWSTSLREDRRSTKQSILITFMDCFVAKVAPRNDIEAI
ncbi:hypothetical protein [Candidatus Tisiphia endosymbiont of Hybos culiciformis]